MEACQEIKTQYDNCFNTWFTERFLKGDHNDEMCEPFLKVYKSCIEKAMKEQHIDLKEIERDLLGTKNENQSPPKNS
uniref:TP53-regulated inhibitor of apoptosis 1 n=1 Tax=Timema genevievae TaxID=629358 RepID=A0A7R9JRT9_TIMGE|nr:unnamed protein product [Timema genevievae]